MAAGPEGVRRARDTLGSVEVPSDALFGAHTARARDNFAVGGGALGEEPLLLRALAEVKAAAAQANLAAGALPSDVAEAIVAAAREVAAGRWNDEFPINLVQGGGGTASNMNVNEVLAARATQLLTEARGATAAVHPNDHVNRSQSTNDVYPTALSIAAVRGVALAVADVRVLVAALERQCRQAGDRTRLGRTCLRDAMPVPIGAPLRAQATAVERLAARLGEAGDRLLAVPLGATAVGTGHGTADGYAERVVALLARETGLSLRRADDPFDALSHFDGYLDVANALTTLMVTVAKIAADVRLLSSGPLAGIGELRIPAVQVGSSCMPGKVNPVMPELVMQVSYEIRGRRHIIEAAVAAGELELNVMEPVIARHLLDGLRSAGAAARLLGERCIDGMQWDHEVVERHLSASFQERYDASLVVGYDAAASNREEREP